MVSRIASAADQHQGMAAGRTKGINVVQELVLGLPQPRKLICRARAEQEPSSSPGKQRVRKSKKVRNMSWPLTVLPQDLPKLHNPLSHQAGLASSRPTQGVPFCSPSQPPSPSVQPCPPTAPSSGHSNHCQNHFMKVFQESRPLKGLFSRRSESPALRVKTLLPASTRKQPNPSEDVKNGGQPESRGAGGPGWSAGMDAHHRLERS